MDPLVPTGDGHTALSDDDRPGLIPAYIATRGDLFDAEQRNIAQALLRRRPPTPAQLLDDSYLRDLHAAMFGDVWSWAGRYRTTETNIGVAPHTIAADIRLMVGDALAWIDYGTYDPTNWRSGSITGSWRFIRSRTATDALAESPPTTSSGVS